MLNENGLTFKDFEVKTFEMICKLGQEYTREFLERYDTYLMENRDKGAYRNKGKRKTTVKTVYGEVEYERRIYQVNREDGLSEFVFLLDEQLEIAGVGLISMNMAEQMVSNIAEMSHRETAEKMTEMTDQRISAMGVWNVIQSLGDKVCEEERKPVKAHKSGQIKGDKEATIAQTYNLDETEIRIMNADGAEWVKNICDAETIFQLEPFHRNKAIKENIPYPKAVNVIHEMLNRQDLDGVFEYIATYKNSLDEEIEKAEKLITYFRNNREGLIPYKEKGLNLPENKQGLEYRNMGKWKIIYGAL